jgi:hypothetical protein
MILDRRRFLDYTLKTAGGAVGLASIYSNEPRASALGIAESAPAGAEKQLTTLLFFDDWPLDRRDHVERHVGHPEWRREATFVDPHLNLTWGYPCVFRDSETGQWRCLYEGWDEERKQNYPVVAESQDGLRWQIPDLSSIHLQDRAYPHQVLPVTNFSTWNPCYYDERAISSERLKGLVVNHTKSDLWVSPDGLHWRCIDGVQWQRATPDPVTSVFWNASRSSYVLTTRPSRNDRRLAVAETTDWRKFSEPELALEADALDTPLAQIYGMPVFPYHGWFVGLLWVFHVSPEVKGQSPLKFLGGKIDCQLSYSLNGWHFQRGLRETFMQNADPGQLGGGCLYPCCMVLDDEETIRIYSNAVRHEHGFQLPGDAGIVLHTLRRDGFTYLESSGGAGVIGTRPLLARGGALELNVLAPDGEVRVQLTDSKGDILPGYGFADSIPFAGDNLHWEPQWKGNQTLQNLPERTLRLEVLLDNARLYAIRGNFKVLTAPEVVLFEQGRGSG